MESRNTYGYYKQHGGITGERKPRNHASGWTYKRFEFNVKQPTGIYTVAIKAIDYEHALKQVKKYVKENNANLM